MTSDTSSRATGAPPAALAVVPVAPGAPRYPEPGAHRGAVTAARARTGRAPAMTDTFSSSSGRRATGAGRVRRSGAAHGGGWWSCLAIVVGALGWVAMRGLTGSFVYYLTPTDIAVGHKAQVDQRVRLGGYVVPGSVHRPADGADFHGDRRRRPMEVLGTGPVPQMFRAGQGVVLEGRLGADGRFHSDTLLVKHNGEYRAPKRSCPAVPRGLSPGHDVRQLGADRAASSHCCCPVYGVLAAAVGATTGRPALVESARRTSFGGAGHGDRGQRRDAGRAAEQRLHGSVRRRRTPRLSTPNFFKVLSLWAADDGSLLLWNLILAGYVAAVAWRFRRGHAGNLPVRAGGAARGPGLLSAPGQRSRAAVRHPRRAHRPTAADRRPCCRTIR